LFLEALAPDNLSVVYGLSGTVLCTDSVDAGFRVSMFGEAGQSVHSWDSRGSQRWMHYDNQLRLKALFEQTLEGEAICAEHLTYAANDPVSAAHNQCGQLISHTDLAGVLLFNDYGLTGTLLEQERRLDDIAQSFSTHSRFNPPGDLLSRTDAQGNEQRFSQTVDGQLRAVDLRLSHTTQRLPMVSAITYSAHGQVEREVAGNGVITTLEYGTEDGRLQRLLSRLGQNQPLQDLRYSYDLVGNVRSIEDAALPIRYFANQRIEPVSDYWYDTLDRLIAATGWEAGAVKNGPSSAMTADPAMPGNYRQAYRYDAGNNLLELTHTGPQNPGHRLVADAHSNRCLPVREGIEPTEQDFRDSFDANGNLLKLQPGQTLRWDARNQLCEVCPVERDTENDSERYVYAADGLRVRKVRSLQTNAQTNIIETLYLPGLEIRTHSGTGEVLHVIDVATGRGSVRVLHWEAGRPSEISNDQQRYSLTDRLGSSTLELDQHANVITQERYYPFGGTAWSNGEAVQVSYKTVRYSGKEQDATGFYYYGLRYYIPWLPRWLNPDPAGYVAGANLFAFVSSNPLRYRDIHGETGIDVNALTPEQAHAIGLDEPQISAADALYDAGIGIKPSAGVWTVNHRTIKSLKSAHVANLTTKMLLVDGAPNQIVDIWRAHREPTLMDQQITEIRSLNDEQHVPAAINAGIGLCGEHARINFHLLASTTTKLPVFRVQASDNVDHDFVVMGDHRSQPLSEIIIVDAWPTFPGAHTAEIGAFGIGQVLESAYAEADPKYQLDDERLIKNSMVEFPEGGSIQRMETIQGMKTYMQLFSMKDGYQGGDYKRDGSRRGRFNQLPIGYVFDRVKNLKSFNNMQRSYGNL
jgi:RHS repeat-associated protein